MDIKNLTRGELVFQLALSLLLIPKTLAKVIAKPVWIPDYIEEELKKESGNQFNSYCHPIAFWLVVGVFSYIVVLIFLVQGFGDETTVSLFNDLSPWLMATGFILFLPAPLSIAFVLQMLKYKTVEKSSFLRSFLIQCYSTAPFQLLYIFTFFATGDDLPTMLFALIGLISIVWLIYSQAIIVKKELGAGFIKTFGVFVLMYISYFFFMFVGIFLFMLLNIQRLRAFIDKYFNSIEAS